MGHLEAGEPQLAEGVPELVHRGDVLAGPRRPAGPLGPGARLDPAGVGDVVDPLAVPGSEVTGPSSSSIWSVGQTEPGLGRQMPPDFSSSRWMIS